MMRRRADSSADMNAERQAQIIALGSEPVRPDSPVGDPVRYDEAFERLQAQMDRINSLTGEAVDWKQVVQLSTDILKSKSKDLLVMTYLVLGLFETEGYAGLTAGLKAYAALLNAHWEGCYPKVKPPHGRYNALQYLVERVLPQVESKDGVIKRAPTASEKEAVHQCADAMAELDPIVTRCFSSQPETPNLLPLVRALKTLREKVGPLVAAAPAAAEQPAGAAAQPAQTGASAAPAAGGGAGIPENFASVAQAAAAITRIAKYLLSQDDKDPRGYRLMRAALFGGLSEPPKDKLLPGPPPHRRQYFENLASSGNWQQLLTEAEGQFATTPMWLDMQRFVALALSNLGPGHRPAADAVILETVALVRRLPAMLTLSFKDNTAFADGATKAWIDQQQGALGGGAGGGGGSNGDAIGAAVSEARKLMSESKTAEAVQRLSAEADTAAGLRNRFRAQLALAEMAADMNKLPLAASILEGLERVVDEYHLEMWEPELAADVMERLFTCLTKARPRPTPDDLARMNAVYGRLCRLRPGVAFKIEPPGAAAAAPK